MIYGLYSSATGVLTSAHRQDVIANNLANVETVGFKRDLALFQERRTQAQMMGLDPSTHSHEMLEGLGGGLTYAPTFVDFSQGELEATGNPLDVAIQGKGFFAVREQGKTMLTRDGRFMVDRQGYLVRANGGQRVLDAREQPIQLDPAASASIRPDGSINQHGRVVGQLGTFEVADTRKLVKHAGLLMTYPNAKQIRPANAALRSEYVERSNADPMTELTQLMETQRQLEANANLIRYQDQTLGRLVNDVGRIG
jgi:flagellar basal-body rod protein FlgF